MVGKRDFSYYETYDAIRKAQGCPLCHYEQAGVRRYFDALAYKCVNDPVSSRETAGTAVHCRRHADIHIQAADPHGAAIPPGGQMQIARRPSEALEGAGSMAGKRRQWAEHNGCPACKKEEQSRRHFISSLAEWLDDEELQAAIARSEGFCLSHTMLLLATLSENARRFLIKPNLEKVE